LKAGEKMKFLFLILCFSIVSAYLDSYYCGAGPLSKTISYLTSSACGTEPINGCCYQVCFFVLTF
jgi:hypothetical protein